jgi:hypothetical protein
MMGLSRRMFLKRGSMAVAMAGVATTMPLLAEVGSGPPASEAASEASSTASEIPAGYQMSENLVAHVRDLGTGEINLFFGERQIVLNDPGLARALFQATR